MVDFRDIFEKVRGFQLTQILKKEAPEVKLLAAPVPIIPAAALPGIAGLVTRPTIKAGTFVKGLLAAPVIGGILLASPRARGLVETIAKGILDPAVKFEAGEEIGEIIEDPSKILPPAPTGEDIRELLEKIVPPLVAGVTGAVAGLGIPKIIKKVKEAKEEILPGQVMPVEVAPSLAEIPGEIAPEVAEVIPVAPVAPPSIKNVFKPIIDIDIKNTGIRKSFKKEILVNCLCQ